MSEAIFFITLIILIGKAKAKGKRLPSPQFNLFVLFFILKNFNHHSPINKS